MANGEEILSLLKIGGVMTLIAWGFFGAGAGQRSEQGSLPGIIEVLPVKQ